MKAHIIALAAMALAACEYGGHDTDEGPYTLLTADFVEAYTDGTAQVTWVETDAGDTLKLATPMSPSWADTPDTTYRAALHYDWSETNVVKPYTLSRITTLSPGITNRPDTLANDPIDMESVWLSGTGKYLNLGFSLMIGNTGDTGARQTVGVAIAALDTLSDGRLQATLRFIHSQGEVPEHYSQKYYISIPRSHIPADIAVVEATTYDGFAARSIELGKQ